MVFRPWLRQVPNGWVCEFTQKGGKREVKSRGPLLTGFKFHPRAWVQLFPQRGHLHTIWTNRRFKTAANWSRPTIGANFIPIWGLNTSFASPLGFSWHNWVTRVLPLHLFGPGYALFYAKSQLPLARGFPRYESQCFVASGCSGTHTVGGFPFHLAGAPLVFFLGGWVSPPSQHLGLWAAALKLRLALRRFVFHTRGGFFGGKKRPYFKGRGVFSPRRAFPRPPFFKGGRFFYARPASQQ